LETKRHACLTGTEGLLPYFRKICTAQNYHNFCHPVLRNCSTGGQFIMFPVRKAVVTSPFLPMNCIRVFFSVCVCVCVCVCVWVCVSAAYRDISLWRVVCAVCSFRVDSLNSETFVILLHVRVSSSVISRVCCRHQCWEYYFTRRCCIQNCCSTTTRYTLDTSDIHSTRTRAWLFSKAPFTRYNRLSNRVCQTGCTTRFDNRLYHVNGV